MYFLKLHSNIKFRVVTMFFNTVTTSMVLPFMAIYFSRNIGLSYTSFILSFSVLLYIIASVISGHYGDILGRKRVMLFSDYLTTFSFLFMAMANSPWYENSFMTVLLFMIHSFSNGLYGPTSEAMLLDVSSPTERKYIYSLMYWIINLSIAIGGSIGALFFDKHLFYLLIGLTLSSLISVFVTKFYIFESLLVKRNENVSTYINLKTLFRNYIGILKNKIFMVFMLSTMLLFSVESHLINSLSIYLERTIKKEILWPLSMKIDGVQMLGILRTENTILVIIFSFITTLVIRKFNEQRLIFVGFLLYVIGYGMISTYSNPLFLIIVMFFAVVGEVLAFPIHQTFLATLIPDNSRGTYLAINQITLKASSLIGTLYIYLLNVNSNIVLSMFIWISGFIGIALLYLILPHVYKANKSEDTSHS